MPPSPGVPSGRAAADLTHLPLAFCFLLAVLSWLSLISLGFGALLSSGGTQSSPSSSPTVFAAATAVQQLGLLGLAVWFGHLLRLPRSMALGTAWASRGALLVAAGSGLLVGFVPDALYRFLSGWLASPETPTVEYVAEVLQGGPAWSQLIMVTAAVLLAPLCEELAFRGFLWRALSARCGSLGTLFVTTLIFAAYHSDPAHAIAIVPTGLLLGWMRLCSSSVWPGVVAHAANNAVAVSWLSVGASDAAQEPSRAWLAGSVGVSLAAAVWFARHRAPPGSAPVEVGL